MYKIYRGFFKVLDLAKSAWISLLIIFIVYGLTYLAQSDTIFIALLNGEDQISLLAFYVILFFLISIVSHYPAYIEFNRSLSQSGTGGQASAISWQKSPDHFPVGFITYVDHRKKSLTDSVFRHLLGILLLAAVYFIAVNTYYNNITRVEAGGDFGYARHKFIYLECGIYLVVSILFFVLIPRIARIKFSQLIRNQDAGDSGKLKSVFWLTTVITVLSILFTVIISFINQWSAITYWSFCFSLYTLSFQYSVMRLCRKRVVFLSDVSFVKFLSTGGFLSVIIILLAHWKPLMFNSFVILISYFIIFYGVIILPIKHYLFYRQYDKGGAKFPERAALPGLSKFAYYVFSWFVPVMPYFFVGWVIYIDFITGNELHRLETVKMKLANDRPASVGINEFNTALQKQFEDKDTIYFIALYGGGLKATVWTDLVLNELASERHHRILDDAVAISGVSGGGIGAGLYTGLREEPGSKTMEALIGQISSKNYVAIDLIYLLGRDFVCGLLPQCVLDFLGVDKDRASRSMQIYANAALDRADYDTAPIRMDSTFQDYWSELFRQEVRKNKFFPALIMNSSATHTQRGISFSVRTDSASFDNIFFDCTNLLTFKDTTSLTFLDATSTVDRFPILSPPAKVEGKGYFLDGGYFENSGLMSLMDYSEYLRTKVFPTFSTFKEKWSKKKFVFIQISNDETVYMRSLVANDLVEKRVGNSQEFLSVLEAVTSISFVSTYLNRKFNYLSRQDSSLVRYYEVHLPYLLNENHLESFYKGTVNDTILRRRIRSNNDIILNQIYENKHPFEYVTPPLGRQMVPQSFTYMQRSLPISGLEKIP